MLVKMRHITVLAALFAMSITHVFAEDQSQEIRKGRWILEFENDTMGLPRSDDNYTMGLSISHIQSGQPNPPWSRDLLDKLSTFNEAALSIVGKKAIGVTNDSTTWWTLGCTAFTPSDITDKNPIQDDRPYAALLYLSTGYSNKHANKDITVSEVNIGLLGTNIGEYVQTKIHEQLAPDRIPKGWNHQIGDGGSPTVLYHTLYSMALNKDDKVFNSDSLVYEIRANGGGDLGYYTRFLAGTTFYFAGSREDLNALQGGLKSQLSPFFIFPDESNSATGFAFKIDYELSIFAYNELLQGAWTGNNDVTFSRDEIETFVHKISGNLELTFIPQYLGLWKAKNARIYYTQNWRSRDIKTDKGKDHHWGGLNLAWSF